MNEWIESEKRDEKSYVSFTIFVVVAANSKGSCIVEVAACLLMKPRLLTSSASRDKKKCTETETNGKKKERKNVRDAVCLHG